MHRADPDPGVGEDDLHALVDGQLAAGRHREVVAYLAAHPDAAERVDAFLGQRVGLAALRESLADGEAEPRLAGPEGALRRVVRTQRRVRRALRAGGGLLVALVAVVSGWRLTGQEAASLPPAASTGAGRVALTRAMPAGLGTVGTRGDDPAILWLQAHLAGRPPRQPDLEPLGLRFAWSEVLDSVSGPAVRLVYTDDIGRAYDLIAGTGLGGAELAALLVPGRHVSLAWRHGPLVFLLAAPQGSERLGEIMRSVGDLLDPPPVDAGLRLVGEDGGPGSAAEAPEAPAGSALEGAAPQSGQPRAL